MFFVSVSHNICRDLIKRCSKTGKPVNRCHLAFSMLECGWNEEMRDGERCDRKRRVNVDCRYNRVTITGHEEFSWLCCSIVTPRDIV